MDKDNPILIALKAAQTAFRAGNNSEALQACLTVLEHVPNHPMAHLMAGLLQQQAGLGELDGWQYRSLVRAAEAAKRELTHADQTTLKVEVGGKRIDLQVHAVCAVWRVTRL